jgi:nitroimidazol reductase NimA-like FMN-containing flavoprotein (pyridoxamine 5'-phosphate oxidase superfamily)
VRRSAPTERTRLRRHPERGVYDRAVIDAILDEALICHLATVVDGSPRVIPTIHARVGDVLYVHGSPASRTLRALREGAEVCVAATLVDGLVLARSGFHSSINYRSVMVYGRAREVTDPDEKRRAQDALVDHVAPGRSTEVRPPTPRELRRTAIFAIPLDEASAKVRTGPPKDDEEDLGLPIWAGVLPIRTLPGPPQDDPRIPPGVRPPESVLRWRRP